MGNELGVDLDKFEAVFDEVLAKYGADFYTSCMLAKLLGEKIGDPKATSLYMCLASATVLYVEREYGGDDRVAAELLKNINLPDLDGDK